MKNTLVPMAYLEPSQTSKTKFLAKIVNGLNHQTVSVIASTHGTNIVGLGPYFLFLLSYILRFLGNAIWSFLIM